MLIRIIGVVALCLALVHGFIAPNVVVDRTSITMMVKRPQLKAAKKANRRRPKKKMPADIYRKAPSFDVEPHLYDGRPPEYEVVSDGSDDFDKNGHIEAVLARLAAQDEYDNTNEKEEAEILAAIRFPDPAQALVQTSKKFSNA